MTGAYLYELGVTPYGEALGIMTELAAARTQGAIPDTVMLLEHEPVITLGSRAVRGEELLMAAVEYTRRGIEVVEVSRGGRSTYHGPGQVVCYPVLDLHGWGDLQDRLNTLSKQGKWVEMGELIDDEVLDTFAVVAEPEDIAPELHRRYGDVIERISFYAPYKSDPDRWRKVLDDLKAA